MLADVDMLPGAVKAPSEPSTISFAVPALFAVSVRLAVELNPGLLVAVASPNTKVPTVGVTTTLVLPTILPTTLKGTFCMITRDSSTARLLRPLALMLTPDESRALMFTVLTL